MTKKSGSSDATKIDRRTVLKTVGAAATTTGVVGVSATTVAAIDGCTDDQVSHSVSTEDVTMYVDSYGTASCGLLARLNNEDWSPQAEIVYDDGNSDIKVREGSSSTYDDWVEISGDSYDGDYYETDIEYGSSYIPMQVIRIGGSSGASMDYTFGGDLNNTRNHDVELEVVVGDSALYEIVQEGDEKPTVLNGDSNDFDIYENSNGDWVVEGTIYDHKANHAFTMEGDLKRVYGRPDTDARFDVKWLSS